MAETIHVRGEGGGIHAMDLPLPEAIAERLTKGLLTRVNADGSPYAPEGPAKEPAGERDAEDAPDPGSPSGDAGDAGGKTEPTEVPAPPTKVPAKAAPKAEWVGWAVVNGADPEAAEAMSKADLVEQYSNQ
jgi:hypothetical protein